MRHTLTVCAAALTVLACGSWPVQAQVVFSDNFDNGASPEWGNQQGNWVASGGVYYATQPSTTPNAYSALPYNLSNYTVDVDINSLKDGGIWVRATPAPGTTVGITGVLLVTGGLASNYTGLYWHDVTDGSSYGNALDMVTGLFNPGVSDAHIRVEVVGDTYSAYVNGSSTPATTLTTTDFTSGEAALYDNSQQTFDNFVLTAVPEPGTFALAGLGLAALAARRRHG